MPTAWTAARPTSSSECEYTVVACMSCATQRCASRFTIRDAGPERSFIAHRPRCRPRHPRQSWNVTRIRRLAGAAAMRPPASLPLIRRHLASSGASSAALASIASGIADGVPTQCRRGARSCNPPACAAAASGRAAGPQMCHGRADSGRGAAVFRVGRTTQRPRSRPLPAARRSVAGVRRAPNRVLWSRPDAPLVVTRRPRGDRRNRPVGRRTTDARQLASAIVGLLCGLLGADATAKLSAAQRPGGISALDQVV